MGLHLSVEHRQNGEEEDFYIRSQSLQFTSWRSVDTDYLMDPDDLEPQLNKGFYKGVKEVQVGSNSGEQSRWPFDMITLIGCGKMSSTFLRGQLRGFGSSR